MTKSGTSITFTRFGDIVQWLQALIFVGCLLGCVLFAEGCPLGRLHPVSFCDCAMILWLIMPPVGCAADRSFMSLNGLAGDAYSSYSCCLVLSLQDNV